MEGNRDLERSSRRTATEKIQGGRALHCGGGEGTVVRVARYAVEWGGLKLFEPTMDQVRAVAAELAGHYNEPVNRAFLTNETDFSAEDVVQLYGEMRASEGRPFLLATEGAVVGDADLRHVEQRRAEYAILVGPRARQGRGLGTRFSSMALVLAFGPLGLRRVYASVRPENTGSLRMFDKVGYVVDTSSDARRYAELPDDVCVSIGLEEFRRAQPEALARATMTTLEGP
jgi:RimJ/RimL family protein N-acetyltransferase